MTYFHLVEWKDNSCCWVLRSWGKEGVSIYYRDPLTNDLQTYSAKEAKEKIDELADAGYESRWA